MKQPVGALNIVQKDRRDVRWMILFLKRVILNICLCKITWEKIIRVLAGVRKIQKGFRIRSNVKARRLSQSLLRKQPKSD